MLQSGRAICGGKWGRLIGLIILGLCCCVPVIETSVVAARAVSPRQDRAKLQSSLKAAIKTLQSDFAARLEEIAKYCEAHELTLEADEVRQFAKPLPPDLLQGENLPRQVQLDIPKDLPEAEKTWRLRLRTLQKEHSDKLFAKAKLALDKGLIRFAYDQVREVARQNPDHTFARRLLGYTQYGNEWVTIYAESMLKKKYVLTEKYGWLKADHVERYEKGERYCNGEWLSAIREAEFRRDFEHAWVVQTDHYKIYTNHSLEMGVELGRHLEDFYRIFFQTFADFLSSPEQIKKLFAKRTTSTGSAADPFIVHYYRTKDEYVTRLQKKLAQPIGGTSGLYLSGARRVPDERVAHFFHNLEVAEEGRLATMFHEATHQLFSEAYTSNPKVGINSDFWVVEAVACYMESFHRKGDTFSLGDPHYIRFQNAQYRYVKDKYYVPMQKLCGMGMDTFQYDPNLSQNYSQGAGLAHFFMHYDDGAYRHDFIAYLAGIYDRNPQVREKPPSLADLTEVAYSKLDQQYLSYITELETGQNLQEEASAPAE